MSNFPGKFQGRLKRIDGDQKLSELLCGRGGSADAVVNVATLEFKFVAVVLIENWRSID